MAKSSWISGELVLVCAAAVVGGIVGASLMRFMSSTFEAGGGCCSSSNKGEEERRKRMIINGNLITCTTTDCFIGTGTLKDNIDKDAAVANANVSDITEIAHHHHEHQQPSASDPFDPAKRKGYLSWDDYFMAIAFLSAQRSKDPNRQELDIMGFPEVVLMTLFLGLSYVCHAEVNAILNTNHASATGQRLYVTMFPCNECAKIIIQSGVAEVVYFIDKKNNSNDTAYVASRKLLSMAGVKVWKHEPMKSRVTVDFS